MRGAPERPMASAVKIEIAPYVDNQWWVLRSPAHRYEYLIATHVLTVRSHRTRYRECSRSSALSSSLQSPRTDNDNNNDKSNPTERTPSLLSCSSDYPRARRSFRFSSRRAFCLFFLFFFSGNFYISAKNDIILIFILLFVQRISVISIKSIA